MVRGQQNSSSSAIIRKTDGGGVGWGGEARGGSESSTGQGVMGREEARERGR